MSDEEETKERINDGLRDQRRTLNESDAPGREIRMDDDTLQKKLIEYEKLSALGRLTANVAHEIRNPVTVIGGLTRRLRKSAAIGEKEREYIDLISAEATRLETILKEVLTFSKDPFFVRQKEDINSLAAESLEMYKEACGKFLISTQKFFSDVPPVYVDKRQITEAINNLVSNAIEAMPSGGILTFATNQESLNEKNYVALRVEDTGVGIPEENLLTIFEPFFTTKVTKKETGLGLPITKKIIEGHSGLIKVNSKVGRGSTFALYFPYRA